MPPCYHQIAAILSNRQPPGSRAQGAITRYLKYALGEIALVVVGILIALQINDWYQDRLDRRSEREYLLSMMRDLTEDTRELRAAIEGNASLLVSGSSGKLRGSNTVVDVMPQLATAWITTMYKTPQLLSSEKSDTPQVLSRKDAFCLRPFF